MRKLTPQTIAKRRMYEISGEYWNEIPLKEIFEALTENGMSAVQEDGTPWSGILCGESSCTTIKVTGNKAVKWLQLAWYKMQSGRYEINVYLS